MKDFAQHFQFVSGVEVSVFLGWVLIGFLCSIKHSASFILRGTAVFGTVVISQTRQEAFQTDAQGVNPQLEDIQYCRQNLYRNIHRGNCSGKA